jgi:anti-sigma regulatory factor (Ser/Thr protein kinase)
MVAEVCLTLNSSLEEVTRLSSMLERFAADHGISDEMRATVNLALEEVVTNIILHGHRGLANQAIHVRVALDAGVLIMRAEDSAPAFDPLGVPAPDLDMPLNERRPGGLGIHLLRKTMDHVEYQRMDGKNCLIMRKRLT